MAGNRLKVGPSSRYDEPSAGLQRGDDLRMIFRAFAKLHDEVGLGARIR